MRAENNDVKMTAVVSVSMFWGLIQQEIVNLWLKRGIKIRAAVKNLATQERLIIILDLTQSRYYIYFFCLVIFISFCGYDQVLTLHLLVVKIFY